MQSTVAKVTVAPTVVFQRVDEDAILVNTSTGRVFKLNRTGAQVWTMLEAGSSVGEIVTALAQDYAVTQSEMTSEIENLLEQLRDEGLVVNS